MDRLLHLKSSIICLQVLPDFLFFFSFFFVCVITCVEDFIMSSYCLCQEFWVGNEELVGMYEKRLGDAGYVTYKLARTNNRGDGTLIFVIFLFLLLV